MTRACVGALAISLLAAPVSATPILKQASCSLARVCGIGEMCAAVMRDVIFERGDPVSPFWIVSLPQGQLQAHLGDMVGETTTVMALDNDSLHLFAIAEDGTTHYTEVLPSGTAFWQGQCTRFQ